MTDLIQEAKSLSDNVILEPSELFLHQFHVTKLQKGVFIKLFFTVYSTI